MIALFFITGQFFLQGQNKRLITGSVIDAVTKEPLPFVTVSLKKQMIGNVSNEQGKFDLYIPQDVVADTLLVNYLGYKHFLMDISLITSPLTVMLEETVVQLEEIVIRPISPEQYILMSMRKVKDNYPSAAFETEAYYRGKTLENKKLLRCDEGIFKTYCQNYQDTTQPINQLLLFRESRPNEWTFMSQSKMGKAAKLARDTSKGKKEVAIDLASILGGPSMALEASDISKSAGTYLDTLKFKSYKYSFAKSSSYNTGELIVINFETIKKVNRARESGKIYIDPSSLAIVKIENEGTLYSVALKAVFFLFSIGIKNPTYKEKYEFQHIHDKWYPKNIQITLNLRLTNNHVFKKDEDAEIEIESFFSVNKLTTENPGNIPLEKRFDIKKGMSEQVHNDAGLTWEGLNIIKP